MHCSSPHENAATGQQPTGNCPLAAACRLPLSSVGTHETPTLRPPDRGRDGLPTTLPSPAEGAETKLVPLLDSWQGRGWWWGFPCGSAGKELPTMQETWVQPLGWEDPPEKGKATHSGILLENSMDCIAHGILQATILEWVAIPSSKETSQPRERTQVSCIASNFFTN